MSEPATIIGNLAMFVVRLVRQVRRFDQDNSVVEQAMDYLRRCDLVPSVLRESDKEFEQPIEPPKAPSEESPVSERIGVEAHNEWVQSIQDDVEFQPLKDFLERLKE